MQGWCIGWGRGSTQGSHVGHLPRKCKPIGIGLELIKKDVEGMIGRFRMNHQKIGVFERCVPVGGDRRKATYGGDDNH